MSNLTKLKQRRRMAWMSDITNTAKNELIKAVADALSTAQNSNLLPLAEKIPDIALERPQDRSHGDFSTNIAMASARYFHRSPNVIASAIKSCIDLKDTYFDKCEVAGPGFINFYLSSRFNSDVLLEVISEGSKYGTSDYGNGKRVLVEFVSANPTGPMHIGNARGGAIGDCLASVMEAAGYNVEREFYLNDSGNQIEKFGLSLEIRYMQLFDDSYVLPEDAYHGQDIIDHAKNFADIYHDKYVSVSSEERRKALIDYALPINIEGLKRDLGKYRITYDNWFRESSLYASGDVQKVIDTLKSKGYTYEKDGATWFKATDFGNDKDIVLVRDNGLPTYICPDIAYHYNKLVTRNFDKAIDILGADHDGYVPRIKGAVQAYGADSSKLDIIIMQIVHLISNGEFVKLSKREGHGITLNDLLDQIPVDAARFFFNMREPSSPLDFDLDLAVKNDSQNPVYYVQYAHARICSIIKNLEADNISARECTHDELALLTKDEEKDLISHIAKYGEEIIASATSYDPARITKYTIMLATLFHKFYNTCRVRGEEENLMQARLYLCRATAVVLKNALTMLKITTPESM
jgi:arginyl-tRNA synthetase